MRVTQIGLGLASLGRPEYINIKQEEISKSEAVFKQNAMQVLDYAYQSGIRYFDTAPSYGKGEQFLIEWHDSRGHSDVLLSTKWGYTYMANWELGYAGKHEIKEHTLSKLRAQWQISKVLLPNLKIYQVHSATLDSGIFTNTSVLQELYRIKKETGLQIGISTSGANQSEIINTAIQIEIEGEALFTSFQVTYNVLDQSAFQILKTLLARGKTVIIKEAMANGRVFENKLFPHYAPAYAQLKFLAEYYKVGVDAIAIRFIVDSLQPDYVLSGALTAEQLEQNLQANQIALSSDHLKMLEQLAVPPAEYWEERSQLAWR